MSSDPKLDRAKTSISVRRDLWRNFGAEAIRYGSDRSEILEKILEAFLALPSETRMKVIENLAQSADSSEELCKEKQEYTPEIISLIEWYKEVPHQLDQMLKSLIKERIEELKTETGKLSK
jgi:metal-responsive CopG/Arc/MetJ family transcriptional regulator